MRLDVFTENYACRYYSHGDIRLHLFVYKYLLADSHAYPEPWFCRLCLHQMGVYRCVIKDFKHLILIICFAAAVLRKFLSFCGLMGVPASVSLSLPVSVSRAPLFSASLPLSPSLPACLCSPLPRASEIADKRETGAASPEKRACRQRRAGSREFLLPPMPRAWRVMQCWSRG